MKSTKIIEGAIVLLVAVAAIVGIYLAGTPNQARKERIDNERSNRLSTLSNDINSYYQTNTALPETLQSLEAKDASWYKDPETEEWFVYEIVSEQEFQLCANFATQQEQPYYSSPNVRYFPSPDGTLMPMFTEQQSPYSHGIGYECFKYTLHQTLP